MTDAEREFSTTVRTKTADERRSSHADSVAKISMSVPVSLDRLGLWELIEAVENLNMRFVELDVIDPALWCVEEVRLIGIATEMNRNTAVIVSLCVLAVDRVRVVLVLLKE